ncbi:flagellar export protein FliJ [Sediminibacillus halophilus]|uniref:Flagellar FliJ protein n=1 Tax=Sediminibacillus halophilus TaxID=482461 RepID=A0A1G9MIH9_9BACI|nr:flagellar export protein FliJ [Sediminibacillus halophilus]SDL74080.1 flagellar FliJ protein [Sediminibacillus halophilus]
MADSKTLEKLLDLRDRDKQTAQKDYKLSVERFEDVASEMYTLLKKKEDAEAAYQREIGEAPAFVGSLTSHSEYIAKLKTKIARLQTAVGNARKDMETKQDKLTAAYVETKKFERIIERKKEKHQAVVKAEESKQMDEISTLQFNKNRDW